MSSKNPDSAARVFLYSSVVWLLVGGLLFFIASAKLVSPGLLTTRALTYGRVAAAASVTLQFGWLGLAALGGIFYVLPRVTGSRMASEAAGRAVAIIFNLVILVDMILLLFVGVQGAPYSELPVYLWAVIVLALLSVAVNVVRTVASRTVEEIYVSVWFFVAASVWAPVALGAAHLLKLNEAGRQVADLFGLNAVLTLWLGAIGMGVVYYILPRATGSPLYSHRLAMVGFWFLAFVGPLAGESRRIFGPSPVWLQTVAITATIGLLVPALALVVNVFGTLLGAWDKVPSHPSARFVIGGSLFYGAGSLLALIASFRSSARVLGGTEAIAAGIWILVLGAFTLWAGGLMTYAVPKIMGRRWVFSVRVTMHFWLTTLGAGLVVVSLFLSGLLTAAVLNAGNANQLPFSSGGGYDVIISTVSRFRVLGVLGAGLFLLGQVIFALHLISTTSWGESRPIEVVVPEGASA